MNDDFAKMGRHLDMVEKSARKEKTAQMALGPFHTRFDSPRRRKTRTISPSPVTVIVKIVRQTYKHPNQICW